MPSKEALLNPKELRLLHELHAEGLIPFHRKVCERKCKSGEIPGVKLGNAWYTTEAAIRSWIWKRSNKAFQQNHH